MVTDHSDRDDLIDGGVQAVTKYLVHGLTRMADVEIHVVSFKYGIKAVSSLAAEGYFRHVLPGASFGTLTGYRKDQQMLNACLSQIQPAVVHGQGAGHNGIVAARSNYPSVITVHGIMTEEAQYYSGYSNRLRHLLLSRLSERHCILRGRHTILISPYVADHFRGRLAGTKYLIPNPIADEFFSIKRHEDPRRVIFAGRLMPLKGVMDLIRATSKVALSQKIELILAGSLDDRQYVRHLKDEVSRSGIDGMVQFRGLLNERQLWDEFGRAAVLVLPSYQETAPMVIIEAMAAGVPVIASNVGGIRYQVKDGETGFLIKPGDSDALAKRLIALLSDRSLRDCFSSAAKAMATDKYRADRVARKTIEVYRSILASTTPAVAADWRFQ
jgi:glycosyltransferase involved in cell wall biosynthesis